MIAKLGDEYGIIFSFIDYPMLICDPAGPITRKPVFQRLGLSNTLVGNALNLTNEKIDPLYCFFVGALPIKVIIPGGF